MAYADAGSVSPIKPIYYGWGNTIRGNQQDGETRTLQNESDIIQLYLDTTSNTDDITQLYSDVTSNDADIATLFTDTTTNADAITALDTGTAGAAAVYDASGNLATTAAGTSGQVLTSNAAAVATWQTLPAGVDASGTAYGVAIFDSTGGFSSTAEGTSGQVLTSNGAALVTWENAAEGGTSGFGTESLLTLDSTSPSVLAGILFRCDATAPTNLETFSDGTTGQLIFVRFMETDTTVGEALTHTERQIPTQAGDEMALRYDGTNWNQLAGNIGMGHYVTLAPKVSIDDWIASTQTHPGATVDVSDNDVRKGATKARLFLQFTPSSGSIAVSLAHGGSMYTGIRHAISDRLYDTQDIALTADATFVAYFTWSWTATTNSAFVIGYYI